MSASLDDVGDDGELSSALRVGTDRHRVDTARWVVEQFRGYDDLPLYKTSMRVLNAYLGGRPLPTARVRSSG